MVKDRLLRMAHKELGADRLKILVTGGTGFVGSHLAAIIAAAGHDVTACGRNRYRYPALLSGVTFAEADLTDRNAIAELCRNCDLVYHAGARSAPWGSKAEFHAANVVGTQNVVDGCLQHNVPRLVHVSSTAVFFEFTDRQHIADHAPLPARFCCAYAESKAAAETVVQEGFANGLNVITIRARAVFGHGDNALLPRLIEAARQKRLRQIGDGSNTIDMTYIDNLMAALLLAARGGNAGTVCTITNGEPIQLWPLLADVLQQLQIAASLRRIPKFVAMTAARVLEWQHRILKRAGEPAMTQYAVGLLCRTQTFDLAVARESLNYQPLVNMQEAVRITLKAMTMKDETNAEHTVSLKMFSTGFTSHPAHLAEHGAARGKVIRFHAMFAVLDHPTEGRTLFDTGYSPRFFDATRRWPYRLYRWTTPVSTSDDLSAAAILKRNGIEPASVRRIILSHFHADHVCGLMDFPDAEVLTSARAWHAVQGKHGIAAVKRAILPELFPANLPDRLRLIDHFHGPGFGPFESTHDVFGDGSVRMVNLTGHAFGQIGLLVQQAGHRCLLAADAAWTSRAIRENLPATLGFRLLAASAEESRASQQKLHELFLKFPEVEIIPTHCPEVAARYGFDAEVDRLLQSRGVSTGHAE